ncbi:hypothetical protein LTR66_013017 [Elasticomyces elasticus]|nr:hypothetical protein LTR66_013017 [Elasticomyces elasticus]
MMLSGCRLPTSSEINSINLSLNKEKPKKPGQQLAKNTGPLWLDSRGLIQFGKVIPAYLWASAKPWHIGSNLAIPGPRVTNMNPTVTETASSGGSPRPRSESPGLTPGPDKGLPPADIESPTLPGAPFPSGAAQAAAMKRKRDTSGNPSPNTVQSRSAIAAQNLTTPRFSIYRFTSHPPNDRGARRVADMQSLKAIYDSVCETAYEAFLEMTVTGPAPDPRDSIQIEDIIARLYSTPASLRIHDPVDRWLNLYLSALLRYLCAGSDMNSKGQRGMSYPDISTLVLNCPPANLHQRLAAYMLHTFGSIDNEQTSLDPATRMGTALVIIFTTVAAMVQLASLLPGGQRSSDHLTSNVLRLQATAISQNSEAALVRIGTDIRGSIEATAQHTFGVAQFQDDGWMDGEFLDVALRYHLRDGMTRYGSRQRQHTVVDSVFLYALRARVQQQPTATFQPRPDITMPVPLTARVLYIPVHYDATVNTNTLTWIHGSNNPTTPVYQQDNNADCGFAVLSNAVYWANDRLPAPPIPSYVLRRTTAMPVMNGYERAFRAWLAPVADPAPTAIPTGPPLRPFRTSVTS